MKLQHLFDNWEDVMEYEARTVIFSERDPADVMYVVISGSVELKLAGQSLGMESAGGMIGEMAMIHPAGTRSATATTLTKVKLARLNRDQFRALVGENTDFAFHVMAVLANRLTAANNFIAKHFA
jgi:CRP-like cAMP-binding protein